MIEMDRATKAKVDAIWKKLGYERRSLTPRLGVGGGRIDAWAPA